MSQVKGFALVISAFDRAYSPCWEAATSVEQFVQDCSGSKDSWDFRTSGVDHSDLPEGIWLGEVRLVDDGPGDWPGSRECVVQFFNERPATKEDWDSFCKGDYPWDSGLIEDEARGKEDEARGKPEPWFQFSGGNSK